jgi:hypothetical protein
MSCSGHALSKTMMTKVDEERTSIDHWLNRKGMAFLHNTHGFIFYEGKQL